MIEQHISEDHLWEIVDGRASNKSERQHLDSCVHCQELLQSLQTFDQVLKELPPMEPSMRFSSRILRHRQDRIAFPWFVSILAGIFFLLFGLSIQLAVEDGGQLPGRWIHLLSFTTIVLILLYFELHARRKSSTGVH